MLEMRQNWEFSLTATRMMFWVDTYHRHSELRYPRIESAPMTGMRPVGTAPIRSFGIATDTVNGLTLSVQSGRLFWTYTYYYGVFHSFEVVGLVLVDPSSYLKYMCGLHVFRLNLAIQAEVTVKRIGMDTRRQHIRTV